MQASGQGAGAHALTNPPDDFGVEANVALLGNGGTGGNVTADTFTRDPHPVGIGHGFAYDLDSDEVFAVASPRFKFTLVGRTGGLPAGGVRWYSEAVARTLLRTPLGELDERASAFRENVGALATTSFANLVVGPFGAGGGVGSGFNTAIYDAYPARKTAWLPAVVFPNKWENLGTHLNACGVVGRWFAGRTSGSPPLILVVENDLLQVDGRGDRRRYRNEPLVEAIKNMAAGLELSLQSGSADCNIDKALLHLTPGRGIGLATFGMASRTARGDGIRTIVEATGDAFENLLAREQASRLDSRDGLRGRAVLFATVPPRVDRERVKQALEESRWNDPTRGFEVVAKFVGPAPSSTVDVTLLRTGQFTPRFMRRTLSVYGEKQLQDLAEDRFAASRYRMAALRVGQNGFMNAAEVEGLLEATKNDVLRGIEFLREASP